MKDTAIHVEHLSKKFSKDQKRSMLYGVYDIIRNSLSLDLKTDKIKESEFWALDDVSFNVENGECLGIIGPNGSGKTTLLSLLNGIYVPDKGKITMNGKVGGLISVGVGFHEQLTGRENIFLNSAILGMTKDEVETKFESIVEFAAIGDFLDTPVKNYSTGMLVRLGFSVAIHCEPDILLVDEVLSVGDAQFRAKCGKVIHEMKKSGKTIVYVSHDMNSVLRLCDKVICLEKGEIKYYGKTTEIIVKYLNDVERAILLSESIELPKSLREDMHLKIMQVKLTDKNGREVNELRYTGDLTVEIFYKCGESTKKIYVMVIVGTSSSEYVFLADKRSNNGKPFEIEKEGSIKCTFHFMPLMPNMYNVGIAVFAEDGVTPYIYPTWVKRFRIKRTHGDSSPEESMLHNPPIISIPHTWG